MGGPGDDLVEEVVALSGRELVVLRPRDSEALLDEEAFEHDEQLPYWAELWPSARALAGHLAGRSLSGRRVLELGCGLGLAGIAAALAGGRVTASDHNADAVRAARENAVRNGAVLEAIVADWREPEPLVAGAPWDLVIASDVLYERRNADVLLGLLPRLVGPRGEVWIADPVRPPAAPFLEGARATGWTVATTVLGERPEVRLHRLRRPRGPA